MDRFIRKEDFLNTPNQFQEDYINWWKPQIGDFFTWADTDNHEMRKVECCCSDLMVDATAKNKGIDNRIPLPSIESLIDYIESKGYYVEIEYNSVFIHDREDDVFTGIQKEGINVLDALLSASVEVQKENDNEI